MPLQYSLVINDAIKNLAIVIRKNQVIYLKHILKVTQQVFLKIQQSLFSTSILFSIKRNLWQKGVR